MAGRISISFDPQSTPNISRPHRQPIGCPLRGFLKKNVFQRTTLSIYDEHLSLHININIYASLKWSCGIKAEPLKQLSYQIRCSAGSQCRFLKTGVKWPNFQYRDSIRVVLFCSRSVDIIRFLAPGRGRCNFPDANTIYMYMVVGTTYTESNKTSRFFDDSPLSVMRKDRHRIMMHMTVSTEYYTTPLYLCKLGFKPKLIAHYDTNSTRLGMMRLAICVPRHKFQSLNEIPTYAYNIVLL